ncbi:MAG TPA: M3 family metallopeptidase [Terracidiphilus sp.]
MKVLRGPCVVSALLLFALPPSPAQQTGQNSSTDPLHAWVVAKTPAELQAWVDTRLAAEKADVEKLIAVKGARTMENTLRPFDDAQDELGIAGNNVDLIFSLADAAPLRDKGQALLATISQTATDLSLNRQVYDALKAVPQSGLDPATLYYLKRSLLEYRLAGVDRDDATRAKIRELRDRLTKLSLAFGRNIDDSTLKITATREELDGLPADYIARHKPDEHGVYTLTSDPPDVVPVLDFAKSAELRRRVYLAYNSRAYPQNVQVLRDLLEARQELATTLGYAHYADEASADKMIGSAANIQHLLDQINEVSRSASEKEYEQLLAFAKKRDPQITGISVADSRYWMEQYRRATYDFNAQEVRPYFPYAEVQAGILKTAARLFHVSFKPVEDAVVWDASVATFDVYDDAAGDAGRRLGRIYLDMHPRVGKFKWFASGPVVPGVRGRHLPEGVLMCNFPGGSPGEPGLMEYNDVVTFFHEFGHLMHHILGGQGEWSAQGGFDVEFDFVEAPSQMLEEMFHDPAILQSFGKDYKTGAVIPTSLIARMNAASAYGRGYWLQRQLIFASYALQLFDRAPGQVDFEGFFKKDMEKFSPFTPVGGDHFFASFGHLTEYGSNYYTYLLDKEIAIDFFAQFNKHDLLDGPTAMRYRRDVLEPGASKPAAELVKDFLGRSTNMHALKAWVDQEFENSQAAAK